MGFILKISFAKQNDSIMNDKIRTASDHPVILLLRNTHPPFAWIKHVLLFSVTSLRMMFRIRRTRIAKLIPTHKLDPTKPVLEPSTKQDHEQECKPRTCTPHTFCILLSSRSCGRLKCYMNSTLSSDAGLMVTVFWS